MDSVDVVFDIGVEAGLEVEAEFGGGRADGVMICEVDSASVELSNTDCSEDMDPEVRVCGVESGIAVEEG